MKNNWEMGLPATPKESPEEKAEKMEAQELDPVLVETVAEEIKKEKVILEQGIDRFPKLKKAVATAMLAMTIWGATMAGTAEARDRAYKRTGERAVERIVGGITKGLSDRLEDIFLRGGTGLTPREQGRAVREQMRMEQKKIANYEKQKQAALNDYRRDLKKAKTQEEMTIAETKYKAALEAIDESFGVKKPESEQNQGKTAPEDQNQPAPEQETEKGPRPMQI